MRSIGMAVALVMALTSAATADPLDDAVGAPLRSHRFGPTTWSVLRSW